MTDYTAKKIILKDRSGNYLIPYIDVVEKAQKDSNGNVITTTYATKTELNSKQASGSYLTGYNKGSSTLPVYINASGVATACGSSLAVSITGSSASCTGNAATATTLATARTINGTSFNGSANITTANWGTARNISVADSTATNTGTAVSVNGSAAVTLKLPATIKANLTGNCSGSSTSCTGNSATATKATQDGSGNTITSFYLNKKESSIHQAQATTTASITLSDKTSCYNITPSAATTFSFVTTSLSTTSTVITFELKICMSTVYTMTFPSTVVWLNNETPDLSQTGTYILTFRTYDGATSWIGCLEGSY